MIVLEIVQKVKQKLKHINQKKQVLKSDMKLTKKPENLCMILKMLKKKVKKKLKI